MKWLRVLSSLVSKKKPFERDLSQYRLLSGVSTRDASCVKDTRGSEGLIRLESLSKAFISTERLVKSLKDVTETQTDSNRQFERRRGHLQARGYCSSLQREEQPDSENPEEPSDFASSEEVTQAAESPESEGPSRTRKPAELLITWEDYVQQWQLFHHHSRDNLLAAWANWKAAGFPREGAPSLLVTCIMLNECVHGGKYEGKQFYPLTEFEPYQDAVVDRLIELLLPDPHAKLETRVLSSLASNVALIGSRYKYDKEITFLYKAVQSVINKLNLREVDKMLTGLAQAEHHYDGMAQKYEQQALACMTEVNQDPEKTMDHKKRNHQSFAYIVKSLAYLAYVPEKLLNHPSVDQVTGRDMNTKTYVNLLWALAALGQVDNPLTKRLWSHLSKHFSQFERQPKLCTQLLQVHLAMKYSRNDETKAIAQAFEGSPFHRRVEKCAIPSMYKSFAVTPAQSTMKTCLESLGFKPVVETLEYGIPLDILVPELNLGIILTTPAHFFRNRQDVIHGKTRFKRRLFQSMGLRILPVHGAQWIRYDQPKRMDYLKRKLPQRIPNSRQEADSKDQTNTEGEVTSRQDQETPFQAVVSAL